MSDDVLTDAQSLARELEQAVISAANVEASLLNHLRTLIVSLEHGSGGKAQAGAVNMMSRFCTESLDWSSSLFQRCASITERARP